MLRKLRPRFTYANVVATLALFLALGGGAYAAATVGSGDIKNNAVLSRHIKDGEVKKSDLAANSVGSGKVIDGSLLRRDFKPGQLSASGPAGGDLTGSYPKPKLRAPKLFGIAQQPAPPAASIDCSKHPLTFCGASPGDYWNDPASGGFSYAGVYVDALGFVHLQGVVERVGHVGDIVFTLPVGMRPSATLAFAADYIGADPTIPPQFADVRVSSDGFVKIHSAGGVPVNSGDLVGLSGISFHP